MRSVSIVASFLLAGALATPLRKRQNEVVDVEYTYVTDFVTIDPTTGQETVVEKPGDLTNPNDNQQPPPDNTYQQSPPPPKDDSQPQSPPPNNYQAPPPVNTPAASPAPSPAPSPSPSPAANAPSSGDAYQDLALQTHNDIRARHGIPALQWDADLASAALVLSQRCNMNHDTSIGPKTGYGQNLAMRGPNEDLVADIKGGWHDSEMGSYSSSYGHEPDMSGLHEWGHYTQTAWKGTTHVGCATFCCGSGNSKAYYTTCNYLPAGNVVGQFAQNVNPPSY